MPDTLHVDVVNKTIYPEQENNGPLLPTVTAFTVQLFNDFLDRNNFQETKLSLQHDLQKKGIHTTASKDASNWSEMYERCQIRPLTKNNTKQWNSTIEAIVQALMTQQAPHTAVITVYDQSIRKKMSGKKKKNDDDSSITFLAAYRAPIIRPSQRNKCLPKAMSLSPPHNTCPSKLIKQKSVPKPTKRPTTQLTPLPTGSTCMSKETKSHMDRTARFLRRDIMDHYRMEALRDKQRIVLQGTNRIAARRPCENRLCPLCTQVFSTDHLTCKISFKSIILLHAKWGYTDPQAASGRYKAPLCYDTVAVCILCYQLLNDLDSYRPTTDPPPVSPRRSPERVLEKTTDPLSLPSLHPDSCIDTTITTGHHEMMEIWVDKKKSKDDKEKHSKERILPDQAGTLLLYNNKQINDDGMTSAEWNVITSLDNISQSSTLSSLRRSLL